MTIFYILLALAIIGFFDTLYLAVKKLYKQKVFCPISSHNCNTVLDSKYNTLLGIPNIYLGFIYYILTIAALFYYPGILIFTSAMALIASIYLTVIQAFKLHNYCSYCLLSAAINLAFFLLLTFYIYML